MEAFSAMLHQRVASGSFTLHPKCAAINLSHLIFADDMFILCRANDHTFQSIHRHLQEFFSLSGLQPNLNKSACFFAGIEDNQKSALKAVLNIPEASFPVTYLGVPLISTKLRYADCLFLKEQILRRIQSWPNKLLSFGGRMQLITSVLFSILKEIESVLNAFLWRGVEMKSQGVKVAWASVCLPKSEGGLGFKRLKEWNVSSMLRHLWAVCKKEDILWVKWIPSYVIKEQCLWSMKLPSDASWTKFGDRVSFNLGRSLNAKVSSIIYQGGWRWPRLRNVAIREIIANIEGGLLPDISKGDEVVWTLTPNGCYSAKSAWMALRNRAPSLLLWIGLIWYGIKSMFFAGLSFCGWPFWVGYPLKKDCWSGGIRSKCCRHGDSLSLLAEVQWGSQHCSKSVSTIIYQWCLATLVYFLWREINSRIFRQVGVDSYTVVKRIEEEIRACLVSMKLSIHSDFDVAVCQAWGIQFGVDN
ncbi:uncharacterized protein LOC131317329 [Rhododendron vialii]|uniref:uncharacterized protein LOC131317329 n=1 Tax=Rhododendron vialii TaxID=182163 RepID=UPI00265F25B4|nr:uncharacterized protein LOC131317329 [Rhododendron vialii]